MHSFAIQPHGVYLALSAPMLLVECASANTLEVLGVEPAELLGRQLGPLFEGITGQLESALGAGDLAEVNPLRLRRGEQLFDGILHRAGGMLVLELEPMAAGADLALGQLYRRVRQAAARLRASHSVAELAALAALELRALTGFDRVTICRLGASGSSETIAEAGRDDAPGRASLAARCGAALGAQTTRMIADVARPPVSVLGAQSRGESLAAHAVLRAASPAERELMEAFGVHASLAIPLVVDELPWGLVACDHESPRSVPYEVRQAAEFLGSALSWRIAARERSEALELQADAQRRLSRLVEHMSVHANPVEGLASEAEAVLELVGASGAVLCHDGRRVRLGRTPPDEQVRELSRWLSGSGAVDMRRGVFAAASLAVEQPSAPALAGAAGVLAVAVEPEEHEYLLWFRERESAWRPFQLELGVELRTVILGGIQRRAKELALLNEELRASNFAKDEFLATVSHELRTPLNAMLGWLNLLETGSLSAEKRPQALETVARNARAQAKLVEDLLDVSRITSGKMRLDVQPVELAQVVDAALETVRPALEAKGIALRMAVDREAGTILGDPQRLQQVVWNLLTNAVKFTPRHGHIDVELERIDAYVVLRVSDDGAGIPSAFLPHVFERFRQAEGSTRRTHKGLGLGLSIVKHLTELHGGQVSATSRGEGKGSTFLVRLPLSPEQVKASPGPAARDTTQLEPRPELAGLKVLVVDDEPDATDFMVALLSQSGVAVTAAGSAMEALERLHRERHDILVSDIGMPGMDGFDLIRRVRALSPEQGARIPAVALTAFTRPQDRARAFLAGFDMYLSKPVDAAELLALLGSLAGRMKAGDGRLDSGLPAAGPARALGGVRALLVATGDECERVAHALREAGASVETATSAGEARGIARRTRPDLLVTAVELADVDGYTLLRQLRASGAEEGGWIPAVALIAPESPEQAKKALLAGFQLYVQRPVQLDVLVSRIARLVGWTVRRA